LQRRSVSMERWDVIDPSSVLVQAIALSSCRERRWCCFSLFLRLLWTFQSRIFLHFSDPTIIRLCSRNLSYTHIWRTRMLAWSAENQHSKSKEMISVTYTLHYRMNLLLVGWADEEQYNTRFHAQCAGMQVFKPFCSSGSMSVSVSIQFTRWRERLPDQSIGFRMFLDVSNKLI